MTVSKEHRHLIAACSTERSGTARCSPCEIDSATSEFGLALAAITEAVDIRRELAKEHPDTFRPDLASSLTSLG